MLPLGLVLSFAGYGLGTWGWLLVKGYNITLREWFSPLHPFTGPLDANGLVPQGSIFPTGKKGKGGPPSGRVSPGTRGAQNDANRAAQAGQEIGNIIGSF